MLTIQGEGQAPWPCEPGTRPDWSQQLSGTAAHRDPGSSSLQPLIWPAPPFREPGAKKNPPSEDILQAGTSKPAARRPGSCLTWPSADPSIKQGYSAPRLQGLLLVLNEVVEMRRYMGTLVIFISPPGPASAEWPSPVHQKRKWRPRGGARVPQGHTAKPQLGQGSEPLSLGCLLTLPYSGPPAISCHSLQLGKGLLFLFTLKLTRPRGGSDPLGGPSPGSGWSALVPNVHPQRGPRPALPLSHLNGRAKETESHRGAGGRPWAPRAAAVESWPVGRVSTGPIGGQGSLPRRCWSRAPARPFLPIQFP